MKNFITSIIVTSKCYGKLLDENNRNNMLRQHQFLIVICLECALVQIIKNIKKKIEIEIQKEHGTKTLIYGISLLTHVRI